MRELTLRGKSASSRILVGEKMENAVHYCNSPSKIVIITDKAIARLHKKNSLPARR